MEGFDIDLRVIRMMLPSTKSGLESQLRVLVQVTGIQTIVSVFGHLIKIAAIYSIGNQ